MYPCPSSYLASIADPFAQREWHLSGAIYTPSGIVTLSDSDFVAGSLQYTEASVSGNVIELGSVYISDASFSIKADRDEYDAMQFKRSKVDLFVSCTLPDKSVFPIPLGKFIITSASLPTSTIEIKCLDYLIKFEVPFGGINIAYPTTAKDIINEMAFQLGIDVAPFPVMINSDYIIDAPPTGNLSCRQALAYCAALLGCNARMNRQGLLELYWYADQRQAIEYTEGKSEIDAGTIGNQLGNMAVFDAGYVDQSAAHQVFAPGSRKSFVLTGYQVILSGIQYEDTNVVYQIGSGRYSIKLDQNPFITENISTVLSSLWNKIGPISYMPYAASVLSNPALQAGDNVKFTTRDGLKSYLSIITSLVYKFRGRMELKAVGEAEETANSMSPMKSAISKISQTLKSTIQEQGNYQAAAQRFTSLMASALGGYPITTDTAFYIADNPDLDAAQTVWCWNINGFGKSVTGKNGPYITGIGADNSIIAWLATFGIVKAENIKVGGSGTSGTLFVYDAGNNPIIKLDQLGITLANGGKLIGGNGVLSSFIFTGRGEQGSLEGDWCELGFKGFSGDNVIERREIAIDYLLPADFIVKEAKIEFSTVCRYAEAAFFDGGVVHTGFGYPRVIKAAKKVASIGLIPIYSSYNSYEDDDYTNSSRYENISNPVFSADSYSPTFLQTTPPSSAQYIVAKTSADISAKIVAGSWQRIIIWCDETYSGSGEEEWWSFQHSGEMIAQLYIIGYLK